METNALATVTPVRRTLAKGTWVKMTYFDAYGFCGRERHPREDDVGFIGQVIDVSVTTCDDELAVLDRAEDVADGTEIVGDCSFACYAVRAPSGRTLDLVDHELEPAQFGAFASNA